MGQGLFLCPIFSAIESGAGLPSESLFTIFQKVQKKQARTSVRIRGGYIPEQKSHRVNPCDQGRQGGGEEGEHHPRIVNKEASLVAQMVKNPPATRETWV